MAKSRYRPALLLGVIMLAFTLFLAGMLGYESRIVHSMAARAATVVVPVSSGFSYAMRWVDKQAEGLARLWSLQAENAALRRENERLRLWAMQIDRLREHAASLEAMTNAQRDAINGYVTARVVMQTRGPFNYSMIANAGINRGIEREDAVVTPEGLLGFIVDVKEKHARLVTIRDFDSRIPVRLQSGAKRAIMIGQGDRLPLITHIFPPGGEDIAEGALIVTSGVEGIFPDSIPVGTVRRYGDEISVAPYTAGKIVDYVQILRYDFAESRSEVNAPGGTSQ